MNNEEQDKVQEAYSGLLEEKDRQNYVRKKNLEQAPKSNGYLVESTDTGKTLNPILVTEIEEESISGVRQKRLVDFMNDGEEE